MSTLNGPSFRSDTLQNKDTDNFFEPEKFKELIGLSQPAPVTDPTVTPPENVAGQVYFDPSAFEQLLGLSQPAAPAPAPAPPIGPEITGDAQLDLVELDMRPHAQLLRKPLAEMSQDDLVALQTMQSQVASGQLKLDPWDASRLQERFDEASAENVWESGRAFQAGLVSAPTQVIGGAMSMQQSLESGQWAKRPASLLKRLWDNLSPESIASGNILQQTIGEEFLEGADPEVEEFFGWMRDIKSTPESRFKDEFILGLLSVTQKAQAHPDFRASLTTLNAMSREEINADTFWRAIGQGLSSLVVILGATAAGGPWTGATVGATMEGGNAAYSQYESVYAKLINEGMDEDQAHSVAITSAYDTGLFYGIAAGALEAVGALPTAKALGLIGKVLSKEGAKQTGKQAVASWFGRVLSSAAAEGGTEFAQTLTEKIISIAQDPTIPQGQGMQVLEEWLSEQGMLKGELMLSLYAGIGTGALATGVPTMPQMVMDASTKETFDEAPTTPVDPSQAPPTTQPMVNPVTGQLEVQRDTPPETTPIDYPTDPDTGQPLDPVTTDTALVVNPVTGQLEIAPAEPSPDAVEAPVAPLEPTEAPVAPEAPLEPTEAPVTPEEPDAPFDQPGGFDQINEIKVWKHQGHKLRDLAKDPKAAQNLRELGIEQLGFAHLMMPGAKDGPAADLAKSLGVEEAAGAFAPSDARGAPRKIADWVNERRVIGHELFHAIWHAQLGDSTKNQIAEAMGSWRPQRVIDRVRPEHPEREIEEAMADIIAGAMYGFQPMRGVGIDKGDVPSGLLDVANEIIQQNPALQRLQDDAEVSMLEELDEQKRKRDLGKPPKPAINLEATAVQQAIKAVSEQVQIPPKIDFEAAANAFVKVDEFKTTEMGDLQQSLEKLAIGMVALDQGKEWPVTKQRPGQKKGEFETVRDFQSEAIRKWYVGTYLKQPVGATVPPEDEVKMEETAEPQVRTFESITSDRESLDAFVQENLDAVQEILNRDEPWSRSSFENLQELLGSEIPFKRGQIYGRKAPRQSFVEELRDSVGRVLLDQAPEGDSVYRVAEEQAPETDAIEEAENPLDALQQIVKFTVEDSLTEEESSDLDQAVEGLDDLLNDESFDLDENDDISWSSMYSEEQGPRLSRAAEKKVVPKLIDAMAAMSKTKTPSFYEMANVLLKKNKNIPISLLVDAYKPVYQSKGGATERATGTQLSMTNPDFLDQLLLENPDGLKERIKNKGTTDGIDPALVLFDYGYSQPKQLTDKNGSYWLFRHWPNELNKPLNHIFGQVGTKRIGNLDTFEKYTGLKAKKITFGQKRKLKGETTANWEARKGSLPDEVKVYIDENPTLGFARGIQLSEETGGTEAVQRRSEIAAKGTAARAVNLERQREDEFSVRELSDKEYASRVSELTRNAIERGRAAGLTESTIRSQLADIGLITEGFFGDKKLTKKEKDHGVKPGPKDVFILANEAGTGKTYVLLGSAAEILNRDPNAIITYVTTGANLKEQIREDGKNILLEDGTPVTDRMRLVSYAELRRISPEETGEVSDDLQAFLDELESEEPKGRPLFILDEPDSELAGVPNLSKTTGIVTAHVMGQIKQQGGMTIISSATPFKNPYHAKYLAATGVFGSPKNHFNPKTKTQVMISGFDSWAAMHGANLVSATDKKTGEVTLAASWWTSDEVEALRRAQEESKNAMEWFRKRGMFTRRTKVLPKTITIEKDGKDTEVNFVEMNFTQVDVSSEMIPDAEMAYWEYADTLTTTVEKLQEEGGGINQNTHAWVVNKLKRISEGAKAESAKGIIQDHLENGKQVIVFTETKAETPVGEFKRPEKWLDAKGKKDTNIYSKNQVIYEYEEWLRVGGKDSGIDAPFTPVAYDVARILTESPSLELELPSVVSELTEEFNEEYGVANYTGDVPVEDRLTGKTAWENNEVRVMIATMGAGGTGVSFHDKTGVRENGTAQVNLSLPWVAAKVDQVAGRVARYGMKSEVSIDWLFSRSQEMPFEEVLARRVASRMMDMNAVVKGISSHELKSTEKLLAWDFDGSVDASDAILNGYKGLEESNDSAIRKQDYIRATTEQENKGGVKPPKSVETAVTPRPMAMLLSRLVGARNPDAAKQKVLDPTVGTGAAIRYVDPSHTVVINDPKKTHIGRALKIAPLGTVSYEARFEDQAAVNEIRASEGMFDSVIVVPPVTPKNELEDPLAFTHIQNGYELLHDNGRMVAVVPESIVLGDEVTGRDRFQGWLKTVNATAVLLPKSAMGYDAVLFVFDKAFDGYSESEFRHFDARSYTNLGVIEEQVGPRPQLEGTEQETPIENDTNDPDTTAEENIVGDMYASDSVHVMLSDRETLRRLDQPAEKQMSAGWGTDEYTDALDGEPHLVEPPPLPGNLAESMPDLKMNQIRLDFERAMRQPIRKIRQGRRRNSGGFYSPKSGFIAVKYSNNFIIQAHEVGHFLHDNFGLMSEVGLDLPNEPLGMVLDSGFGSAQQREMLDQFDNDMAFWINANGSSAKKASSPNYVRGEMVAAFLVEYMFNPDNARAVSPWFTQYLEQKLNGTNAGRLALAGIQAYGLKVRHFHTQDKLKKVRSAISYPSTWNRLTMSISDRFKKAVSDFDAKPAIKWGWDRFVYEAVDDLVYLKQAIDELGTEAHGPDWQKKVRGRNNPLVRISAQHGHTDRFWEQVQNGVRDILTGRRVNDIGFQNILEALAPITDRGGIGMGEAYQNFEAFMLIQSAHEDALNNWKYAEDLGRLYTEFVMTSETAANLNDAITSSNALLSDMAEKIEKGKLDPEDPVVVRGRQQLENAINESMDSLSVARQQLLLLEEEIALNARRLYGKRVPDFLQSKGLGKTSPGKAIEAINHYAKTKNYNYTPVAGGFGSSEAQIKEAMEVIEALDSEVREAYEEAGRMWREWARSAVLKPLLDSGRISQELYDEIVSQRDFYATMQRLRSDVEGEVNVVPDTHSTGITLGKDRKPPERRAGSLAMFVSPTDAMFKMAHDAQIEAERNLTAKAIVELLHSTQAKRPEPNLFDQDMPPESHKVLYLLKDPADAYDGGRVTADVITVWNNGEPMYYKAADQKVAESFAGLGRTSDWGMFEFINTVRGAMQWNITTTLGFSVYSRFRDGFDRAIKSRGGSKPWDSMETGRRALRIAKTGKLSEWEMAREDFQELESKMVSRGGSVVGTWFSVRGGRNRYDKAVTKAIKLHEGNRNVVLGTAKDFFKNYQNWKKSGEMKNRLAEYVRVSNKLIEEGLDPYDAELEAVQASRDLIEFAEGGRSAKQISKAIMFFNPTIQGLRSSARAAKNNPGLFMARLLAYSVAPSIFMYAWNWGMDADEEYEELPEWEKVYAWNFRIPGSNKWLRIPKPFELAAPGTITEMLVRDIFTNSPDPYGGVKHLGSTLGGPVSALYSQPLGIFTPVVTKRTNYDFFFNSNVVPIWDAMKPVASRNQKSMANQPAFSQTSIASLITSIATGDITDEESALTAFTEEGKQDPRMVSAVWRAMGGISGQTISKAYQAAVDRDPESVGDLLRYYTGKIITWDDKPARASIDRFYETASKLKLFPSDQAQNISSSVAIWEVTEDPEEKLLLGRALVNLVRTYNKINQIQLEAEKKVQRERNRAEKKLREEEKKLREGKK